MYARCGYAKPIKQGFAFRPLHPCYHHTVGSLVALLIDAQAIYVSYQVSYAADSGTLDWFNPIGFQTPVPGNAPPLLRTTMPRSRAMYPFTKFWLCMLEGVGWRWRMAACRGEAGLRICA